MTDPWRSSGTQLAGTPVVTGLPQLFAAIPHAVFISDSAKITRPGSFSITPARLRRYNVLLANDLDLPGFGIRPVIHKSRRRGFGRRYFWLNAGAEQNAPPTWRT